MSLRSGPSGTLPRNLHPGAWWLWALGLATAASRTANPPLLALLLAVAGFVVMSRRTDSPWARAYGFYLKLGLLVIAIRVVFGAVFGAPLPGRVLAALPEIGLPDWAAGVRLGGDVTLEMVMAAAYDGLQLATLLACIGAANALANPKRLLRAMPGALYEVGVAVVVALSFSPQLVTAVSRIRAARRLRGRPDRGLRGLRGVAMPVLQDALERSVDLAAAMDSRGFGRDGSAPASTRQVSGALTLTGLLGAAGGSYGLLDATSPALLGLPLLAAGCLLAVLGLVVGGRTASRSRYRPDRWAAAEWLTAASGLAAAAAMIVTSVTDDAALFPSTAPLVVPALPLVPLVGVLVALLPAWVSPVAVGARPDEARHDAPRQRIEERV
jgi:energy-coupling factor transport system permease protein